ncbi:hypothetical protein [Hymenobacter sp.]|uniref:hypothetical protein n=1 Tax=Hymenobacter sp. TaxID=1898978 RepID=UPI00286C316D|nr:hypothetical protein [Hymenobacter sp.]
MNNFSPSWSKLVAMAACALTLGSCNRAEYAMLPKGSSYHGVTRVATPVPARRPVPTVAAAPAPAVTAPATALPAAPAKQAPAALEKPQPIAVTPAPAPAPAASALGAAATPSQTAPARKPSLVQRLALAKLTKKLEKATQKSGSARQHGNTAATQKLEGRLRQGIILVLIGLVVEILAAAIGSGLVYLLGAILILIGLIVIVLYLLDEL